MVESVVHQTYFPVKDVFSSKLLDRVNMHNAQQLVRRLAFPLV